MRRIKHLRSKVLFICTILTILFFVLFFLTIVTSILIDIRWSISSLFTALFLLRLLVILSGYDDFLFEEIKLVENQPYTAKRSSAVKMRFSSFLKVYQAIPNNCTLQPGAVYFSVVRPKKSVLGTDIEDRMYVYFGFFDYLRYLRYLKSKKKEANRKEEEEELKFCLDIIESIKSDIKKKENQAKDEIISGYNDLIRSSKIKNDFDELGTIKNLIVKTKHWGGE